MLVKTSSPGKFKVWWLLPLVLLLLPLAVFAYRHLPQPTLSLLSPLPKQKRPDLSDKLSQKITPPLNFDFSQLIDITTISPAINYFVYNPKTGRVYAAKNHDQLFSPASFTKLLTAQVALDVLPSNQVLEATPQTINREPTVLGLKSGEQLTLLELLRGAISTSANDAAAVIGTGTAHVFQQPPDFFVDLMNQKAQYLKMTNSRFANPEGYDDPNQYSTLLDIAQLIANSSLYPEIISAGAADRDDLRPTSTHGFYYLPNWNGLLNIYPGVTGLKVAYTESAGYSTIVTANRNQLPVVVILTGADSIRERDLAAAALLDAAYIAQKVKPANIRAYQVNQRYKQWNDLARQIKAELKALEENPITR